MQKRPALERFMEKIDKKLVVVDGKFLVCWIWTAQLTHDGYGKLRVGRKNVRAHVWAYNHWVGPVPKGKQLDHYRCKNPACCNPDHVRPATPLENVRNGRTHNAVKTHCKNGHPFTPENTRISQRVVKGKTYPMRTCRTCHRKQVATHKRRHAVS